ncbi:hypothetical protein EMCRGX_G008064 [Ephydatia muelleri]
METLSEAKDTPATGSEDDLVDHVYLYLKDKDNCKRFTWKGVGLVEDVKNIVSTCDLCQRMNSKLTTAAPELHPVPVQSPWFHLGVDPISPVSSKGNCFILTLSDYFTKWVEAVPLPTKESSGIAQALIRIFLHMGFPTLANGLDERWNQTLKTMIVKYTESKKELWDEYLDSCVFAYNTSFHESSLLSPFEVMFGRKAIIPIELSYHKAGSELLGEYLMLANDVQSINELKNHRLRMLEKVIKNISTAQGKQKQTYDRKHARPCWDPSCQKGLQAKKHKGGKMDAKWLGPFLLSSELGKVFYSLASLDGKTVVVKRINGAHLVSFTPAIISKQLTSSASHKQPIAADDCDLKTRIDSSQQVESIVVELLEYFAVCMNTVHLYGNIICEDDCS